MFRNCRTLDRLKTSVCALAHIKDIRTRNSTGTAAFSVPGKFLGSLTFLGSVCWRTDRLSLFSYRKSQPFFSKSTLDPRVQASDLFSSVYCSRRRRKQPKNQGEALMLGIDLITLSM